MKWLVPAYAAEQFRTVYDGIALRSVNREAALNVLKALLTENDFYWFERHGGDDRSVEVCFG